VHDTNPETVPGTCEQIEFGPLINRVTYCKCVMLKSVKPVFSHVPETVPSDRFLPGDEPEEGAAIGLRPKEPRVNRAIERHYCPK
jgi:hypothetical protein